MQARQQPHAAALRQIEGSGDVDAVIDQNILLSTNAVLKVQPASCAQSSTCKRLSLNGRHTNANTTESTACVAGRCAAE